MIAATSDSTRARVVVGIGFVGVVRAVDRVAESSAERRQIPIGDL
jgi:hypothetical protein